MREFGLLFSVLWMASIHPATAREASVFTRTPAADNESYLNVLKNEEIPGSSAYERRQFLESFMPDKDARSMRQEWEDYNRSYEVRSQSGLTRSFDDGAHQEALGSFTSSILARLFRHQVERTIKETANRSTEIRSVEKSFESAGRAVSSTTEMAASEPTGDLAFRSGYGLVLPSSKLRFWAESKIWNATFEAQYARPWAVNPWNTVNHNTGRERDPLLLTLTRQIPFFEMESSFRYGFSTTWVEGALSKYLAPRLKASLTAQSGVDYERAGVPPSGEKTVRLDYEFHF